MLTMNVFPYRIQNYTVVVVAIIGLRLLSMSLLLLTLLSIIEAMITVAAVISLLRFVSTYVCRYD